MRLNLVLALLCGLLAGTAGTLLLTRGPATDEATVRAIVAEMIAETPAAPIAGAASTDMAELGPMIETYLVENPRILQSMSSALNLEVAEARRAATLTALTANEAAIYDDPANVVIGNPEGDVTLVEFFDYNCAYCRSSLPDIAALIAEDPNLRVILKEFPILSEDSKNAARVGITVAEADVDYWIFHQALFTSRGQVTGDTALEAAQSLGLNPLTLGLDASNASVQETLDRNFALADALSISGTPTFIIGDEIIPGAVGIDQLRTRIANIRACGKTVCEG